MLTKANKKKKKQLGRHPATAAHTLRVDLLYHAFVTLLGHTCFRCQQPMSRKNFSIDHIDNWLDSDDPTERFFNLSNIAFSHLGCNVSAGRKARRKTDEELAELPEKKRKQILADRRRDEKDRNYERST